MAVFFQDSLFRSLLPSLSLSLFLCPTLLGKVKDNHGIVFLDNNQQVQCLDMCLCSCKKKKEEKKKIGCILKIMREAPNMMSFNCSVPHEK